MAQHKKSKAPGDTIEMVDARQRILESKLYQPISDLLNQWVSEIAFNSEQTLQLADIGCGEGYYTERLYQSLTDHLVEHHIYGVDNSKKSFWRAAKRSKSIHSLVACGGERPLFPQQLDIFISF